MRGSDDRKRPPSPPSEPSSSGGDPAATSAPGRRRGPRKASLEDALHDFIGGEGGEPDETEVYVPPEPAAPSTEQLFESAWSEVGGESAAPATVDDFPLPEGLEVVGEGEDGSRSSWADSIPPAVEESVEEPAGDAFSAAFRRVSDTPSAADQVVGEEFVESVADEPGEFGVGEESAAEGDAEPSAAFGEAEVGDGGRSPGAFDELAAESERPTEPPGAEPLEEPVPLPEVEIAAPESEAEVPPREVEVAAPESDPAPPPRKRRSVAPPAETPPRPPQTGPLGDHELYRRETQKLVRARDWKKLAELTAEAAEKATWAAIPETRASLLSDLARIHRDRLKNLDAAEQAYRTLATVDAAHPDAIEFLSTRFRQREDWRALHDLYAAAVDATWDPDQRLGWTREAADIASDRLRSVDLTIAAWDRLWRLGDAADEAVRALSDVCRRARRWDRLSEFLAERAEQRTGAGRRVLRRELAEAYLSGLRDHEKAAEVLERILAENPDDVLALLGMGRVLARRQDWTSLSALGERPLDGVPSDAVLDFRRLVADALWAAGEVERSMAIHERVLLLDPDDPDALRAKEEFFDRTGKTEALVAFLSERADKTADPQACAKLLARAAELADRRLDNPRLAASLWERRAALDADRLETFRALADLYERLGEPEGVARALEGRLALTRRPSSRIELLRRLGEHYAHRLADDDRAEACWKQVLSFLPDDDRTREELIELLRRRGDYEALDRILSAQAARATDPAVAVGFWRAAASNVEQNVYDPARAVRAWSRVLDLDPSGAEVLGALVRHQRNVGRRRELIAALETDLQAATDPAARLASALEVASLWEQEERPAAALAVYERVLRWDPREPSALEAVIRLRSAAGETGAAAGALDVAAASLPPDATGDRIALLRRALSLLPAEDKLARFHLLRRILRLCGGARDVLAETASAAAEAGAWRELATVYLDLAAAAPDDDARAGVHRELAALYEQRENDPTRAFVSLQAASLVPPRDPATLDTLARLAEATGRFEDLLALLDVAVRSAESPQARRDALRRRARICEEKLHDGERAFLEWTRVLLSDPKDAEAIENARRLAGDRGLWRQLDALYAELWDRAETAGERVELARARHRLHAEPLTDPSGALDQLLVVHRLDPDAEGLAEQLAAAADALAAWGRLLPMLEARVRSLGAAAAPEDLARCADLYEQKREDRDRALELYGEAFGLRPSWDDLRGRLERLADAVGRHDVLAAVYRLAAARSAGDRDRCLDLSRRLPALYAERLDRPGEQLDVHQRILQVDPADRGSLEVVIEHHRTAGNWRELRDRLQQWIGLAGDDPGRTGRWLEIARISRERLADPESALSAYASVLQVEPANEEAAEGVRSLTEGPIEPSLELRRLRLELARAEGERRVEIRLACARIQEEQLDDPAGAVETLRELVGETGPAGPGYEPLARLLREQTAWTELVDLIEARAGAIEDPAARVLAIEEAIAAAEDHASVVPVARRETLYRRLLAERPGDMEPRRRLLSVFREAGRLEDLAAFLEETLAGTTVDGEERGWIEAERIRVLDRGLGRTGEAEKLLADAAKRTPEDPTVPLALASLKLRRGDFGGWLTLRREHARGLSPAEGALALCHLAEACDETEGQQTRVAAFYREARTLDGNCTPAIKAMQAIGRRTKNWRDAAALLAEPGERELPWPDRAARLRAAGDASAESDPAEALSAYQRAVAVDPDHHAAWDALARLQASRGNDREALAAERQALAAFERSVPPDPQRVEEHAGRIQRVAEALRRVGEDEEADRMSARAWRLVPSYPPAALAVAERLLVDGDSDGAFALFDRVLQTPSRTLTDAERLQATFRRGALAAGRGRRDEAVADLRDGLRIDPLHSGLLNAMADVLVTRGRVAAAVQHCIQALLVAHESTHRAVLYGRLGRLWEDRLSNADEAGACFDLSIAAGADDHELLVRALRYYRRSGQSESALAVIERLLPSTTDPAELALLWTERAGALAASDEDQALEAYDMALSYDPGHQDAVTGLAAILERRGDWDQLLGLYEARVESGAPEERAHALRSLAGIARDRLGDVERAERYLRQAIALAPAREDFEQILEFIGDDPARFGERQGALAGLLGFASPRVPRLIELGTVLAEAGKRRHAWCILSPLAFVTGSEGGLKTLLLDLRKEFDRSDNLDAVSPETHFRARHPAVVPGLFDVLVELDGIVPLGPATPDEVGATGVTLLDGRTVSGKAFIAVAERLGIAEAELLRAQDTPVPVQVLDAPTPQLVVRSELLQLLQPAETSYLLASILELTRPGARLVASLGADRLRGVASALFSLTGLGPVRPEGEPWTDRIREGCGDRLDAWKGMLEPLAESFAAGVPLAERLHDGVHETARRVGLAAAGELRLVARMLNRIDPEVPKLPTSGRADELEPFLDAVPLFVSLLAWAAAPEFTSIVGS